MVETILNAPDFCYQPTALELIDPLPYLVNNVTPYSGFTPIFFAGINRQYKIVEILLERGADVRIKNSAQQTIMEFGVAMSDDELVARLCATSGIDDLNKPRCHPRLFTPPRCLKVEGVSPPRSPAMADQDRKPSKLFSKTPMTSFGKPATGSRVETPLRPVNRNLLQDESFSSDNPSFSSTSSHFSHSTSFYSENFTPLAKSSLRFAKSTLPEGNSKNWASPKVLSSFIQSSPYLSRTASPSPKMPTPNCWYYHYPSPQYQQTPLNSQTPIMSSKSPHSLLTPQSFQIPQINLHPSSPSSITKSQTNPQYPQTFQMSYMNAATRLESTWSPQSCRQNFLTPQNTNPRRIPRRSFVEAFVTPMKSGMKKVPLRTKLLNKLYKRKKLVENDENQSPDELDGADDLENFLEHLGLRKFRLIFEINEVEPGMFRFLNDDDLQTMGIQDRRDRKLILEKIQKKLPKAN